MKFLHVLIFVFAFVSVFSTQKNSRFSVVQTTQEQTHSLIIDPVIQDLVNQVDSSKIVSTLTRLEALKTRFAGNATGRDSLARARDWLIQQVTSFGYSDIQQHTFTQAGNQLQNIIVTKTGNVFPDSIIILCGHYDSVNGPGINDNGTGTAITLEVARIVSTKQFDYTIRFIFFSAEEQGLVGSNAYVQQVVVPQQHQLKLVINIDEVGGIRENPTNIVKVEKDIDNNPSGNNAASAMFTDSLAALTRTYSSLQTTITNAFGSDYIPFENAGYVITGYYEFFQTPHYHQQSDSLSHVDMHYVKEICKGTVAGVATFAGVKKKFLSLFHTPLLTSQDTVNDYSYNVNARSSSSVTSAKVYYSINNSSYNFSNVNYDGMQNDTLLFSGSIPKQNYGTTIRYYFHFVGEDSVVALLPSDTSHPFSFQILPDTISPNIVHTPLSSVSWYDFPLQIFSNISDENGIHIAYIDWTKNNESFTDTMEEVSQNNWRGFLSGNISAGDSISYVIFARDNSLRHNLSRFPQNGTIPFRVLQSLLLLHLQESDSGNFSPNNDWQFGNPTTGDIPPSPTGLNVWGTNLDGNYSNNITSLLETPFISLSEKRNAVLVFKHYFRTEPGNDGGNVQISVNGNPFQLMIPQGGYSYTNVNALNAPGFSGNAFQWKEERFNLSSFGTDSVKFVWKFSSDALTSFRGWYVDAVRLDYLPDSTYVIVKNNSQSFPEEISLEQNFPNPFNPTTNFRFHISESGFVSLKVYDVLGEEIVTVVHKFLPEGTYNILWDASKIPSGVYFYQLKTAQGEWMKKLLLLK
ncbi:MAG: M20/M25/M40 family metallo-hydrolase [Ignavibacteria bacterium]|nr:M20/M25/M40 family metallo-hydrolase [Ignavibacteria bacterium]